MFNKRCVSLLAIVFLLISTFTFSGGHAFAEEDINKGSLVIIGGALDPGNADIYNRFIELGGGAEDIKIAIIPTASNTPFSSSNSYKLDFIGYGVSEENIWIVPIAVRDDRSTDDVDESTWSENGFSTEIAEKLLNYNAIFFVGGDQLRIVNSLVNKDGSDGPVLKSMRKIYKDGGVLGGSSAGAAIMSDPMISGGTSLGALVQGVTYEDNYGISGDNRVFITKGLGFFENAITDQHFMARGRLGRLIVACLDQGINMGFGIDEDTALVVKGDEVEVVGTAGVTIVDTSMATFKASKPGLVSNVKVHYIEAGDKYNLSTGKFTINEAKETTEGYEYYKGNTLNTDIFAKDIAKQAMTTDLVDNTAAESIGISFEMKNKNIGDGIHVTFRKGLDTEGYWGKINGLETYAALNVYMDMLPIQVNIKPKTNFKDIVNHWAEEYIVNLENKGILEESLEFRPNALLTEQEFAIWLERAFGEDARHLVSNPGDLLSREKMVYMALTMSGYIADNDINININDVTFKDSSSISSYAQASIEAAASKDIIKGKNDGKFYPEALASKAEAAVVLSRLLSIIQ